MAPSPLHAAEMLLIRLAYASQLPSPAEALEALAAAAPCPAAARLPAAHRRATAPSAGWLRAARPDGMHRRTFLHPRPPAPGLTRLVGRCPSGRLVCGAARMPVDPPPPVRRPSPPKLVAAEPAPLSPAAAATAARCKPRAGRCDFADVVDLARDRHEGLLYGHLMTDVHLVRFETGQIELRLAAHAAGRSAAAAEPFPAGGAPASRWMVTVSHEAGEPTLHEQRWRCRRPSSTRSRRIRWCAHLRDVPRSGHRADPASRRRAAAGEAESRGRPDDGRGLSGDEAWRPRSSASSW